MKELLSVVGAFALGYWAVTKLAPIIQAKVESYDLDRMWEIWSAEDEDEDEDLW